jgi:hypothetical protein
MTSSHDGRLSIDSKSVKNDRVKKVVGGDFFNHLYVSIHTYTRLRCAIYV